jgi:hypothetical protein
VKYDVSDNALLSDDAKALVTSDAAAFAAQNELAEVLLELDTDPTYEDEPDRAPPSLLETKISKAVTLQVNYQLQTGIEAFAQAADGPMEVRNIFRSVRGQQPVLHPQAVMIRDQVRMSYAEIHTAPPARGFSMTVRSLR